MGKVEIRTINCEHLLFYLISNEYSQSSLALITCRDDELYNSGSTVKSAWLKHFNEVIQLEPEISNYFEKRCTAIGGQW